MGGEVVEWATGLWEACGVMFGSQERFQTQTQTKELEQAGILGD